MINFDSTSAPGILNQVQEKKTDLMEKLATGKQVNSASDGAAAQQIIDRLTSEIEGNRQALGNVYSGISLAQVAEGGMQGINDDVTRIRELSVQAGNGSLSEADKGAIQAEITALQENITQTAERTTFGGKPLLSEEGALNIQAGANAGQTVDVQTNDVVRDIAAVLSVDVTAGSVSDALAASDAALETLGAYQSELGATQNQLAGIARNLTQSEVNTAESRGRLQDLNYAQAASQQATLNIQSQAAISVQSMANQQEGQVLALLS